MQIPAGQIQPSRRPENTIGFQQTTFAPWVDISWDDAMVLPFHVYIEASENGGPFAAVADYNAGYAGPGNTYGWGGSSYTTSTVMRARFKKPGYVITDWVYTNAVIPLEYLISDGVGPFGDQGPITAQSKSSINILSLNIQPTRGAPNIFNVINVETGDIYDMTESNSNLFGEFILCHTLNFKGNGCGFYGRGNAGGNAISFTPSASTGGNGPSGGGGGGGDSGGGTRNGGNGGSGGINGDDGTGNLAGFGGVGYAQYWMDAYWAFEQGQIGGNTSNASGGIGAPLVSGGGAGGSNLSGVPGDSGGGGSAPGGSMCIVANRLIASGGHGDAVSIDLSGGNGGNASGVEEGAGSGAGGNLAIYAKEYTGFFGFEAPLINVDGGTPGTGVLGSPGMGKEGNKLLYSVDYTNGSFTNQPWDASWNNR